MILLLKIPVYLQIMGRPYNVDYECQLLHFFHFHLKCDSIDELLLVFRSLKAANGQGSLAHPPQKIAYFDANCCIRLLMLSTLTILMLIVYGMLVNVHDLSPLKSFFVVWVVPLLESLHCVEMVTGQLLFGL